MIFNNSQEAIDYINTLDIETMDAIENYMDENSPPYQDFLEDENEFDRIWGSRSTATPWIDKNNKDPENPTFHASWYDDGLYGCKGLHLVHLNMPNDKRIVGKFIGTKQSKIKNLTEECDVMRIWVDNSSNKLVVVGEDSDTVKKAADRCWLIINSLCHDHHVRWHDNIIKYGMPSVPLHIMFDIRNTLAKIFHNMQYGWTGYEAEIIQQKHADADNYRNYYKKMQSPAFTSPKPCEIKNKCSQNKLNWAGVASQKTKIKNKVNTYKSQKGKKRIRWTKMTTKM